jgi:hypothetical protein
VVALGAPKDVVANLSEEDLVDKDTCGVTT